MTTREATRILNLDLLPGKTRRVFPVETLITGFAAGHGWTKQTGAGTQSDDTSEFITGTQSLSLTTAGDGVVVFTRKTGLSLDLSGKYLKTLIYISDISAVNEISIYASSDGFVANWYYWRLDDDITQFRSKGWFVVTLSFGEATVVGTPNREAITAMQIRIDDNAATPLTVKIDNLSSFAEPSAGACVLTFDDGWQSQFTEARKKMDQYQFPGVAYIIPSLIGTSGYMTRHEVNQLADYHRWDICVHDNLAFTSYASPDDLTARIQELRNFFKKEGLLSGIDDVSYPNGAFDQALVLPYMRRFFRSGRTIANYAETIPPGDFHRLRVMQVLNTTTTAAVATAVTNAIDNKHLLILVFHKLVSSPSVSSEYSITNFGTIVDDINSQGIAVKTLNNVLNEFC